MEFSPRLSQILFLLSNAREPIPAGILGEQLQISKRTVFRELENIDRQLAKYHLCLETKSKKGIYLQGSLDDKENLKKQLSELEYIDPKNKEDRRKRLIRDLLEGEEPKKIYYFSQLLDVSEGTASGDLERAEQWLEENDIVLIRKPGLGIYLEYEEKDYRKALMRYIYQYMNDPFHMLYNIIGTAITEKVILSLEGIQDEKLNQLAENSYIELVIYLSVMIKRVLAGHFLAEAHSRENVNEQEADYTSSRAVSLALENQFSVSLPEPEKTDLYIYIKGVKLQYVKNSENLVSGHFDLRRIIYEMIHQYDQRMASQLKHDESLVNGLLAHLKPTIVRLQNNIVIHNPFQQEIEQQYPDIYQKTRQAVKVLEAALQVSVPQEETGLLALHFGGAAVRQRNNEKLLRKISVGVICASGIGISALLSSRISYIFHDKVNVTCLSVSDVKKHPMNEIEIFISTFNLDGVLDHYIQINPMLTEADVAALSDEIDRLYRDSLTFRRPKGGGLSLEPKNNIEFNMLDRMSEVNELTEEITSILKSFDVYTIPASSSFAHAVDLAAGILGESNTSIRHIHDDIMKREALSTQVIPEFGFALLHARTKGVDNSKIMIILPDGAYYTDPYFQKAEAIVVMLIPDDIEQNKQAIASISLCLFEDEAFLTAVKAGDGQECRQYIESILSRYFMESIKENR